MMRAWLLDKARRCRRFLSAEISVSTWFRTVVLSVTGSLAFCALAAFCVDPCLRYDKPPFLKPYYKDPYRMVPSLLMYREYDSLVAGTSMCMNFSLADVRTCLKWKAPQNYGPGMPLRHVSSFCRPGVSLSCASACAVQCRPALVGQPAGVASCGAGAFSL